MTAVFPLELRLWSPGPKKTARNPSLFCTLAKMPNTCYYKEFHFARVAAQQCNFRRSQLPIYCGHFDHQTVATPDIRYDYPEPVSGTECAALHNDLKYNVLIYPETDVVKKLSFDLEPNTTNILPYTAYGSKKKNGKCVV